MSFTDANSDSRRVSLVQMACQLQHNPSWDPHRRSYGDLRFGSHQACAGKTPECLTASDLVLFTTIFEHRRAQNADQNPRNRAHRRNPMPQFLGEGLTNRCRAPSGLVRGYTGNPGRCPGLDCCSPFGASGRASPIRQTDGFVPGGVDRIFRSVRKANNV